MNTQKKVDGPVRFGLIGCGTIADVHLSALSELDNATIEMVSSRNPEKAEACANKHNCRFSVGHQGLLADNKVDAVIITTSSGSHAPIAIEALQAGKHVIVEKPMAMNAADAQRMCQLAREKGLLLSVIFQRRFEPHHQAAKQAIAAGALGKILLAEVACPYYRDQAYYDSADWRGTLAEDGGALMNQAIHSVDLMLWLVGPAESVTAETATQTHAMEAEDMALAIARLKDGGFATIMASTSIRPGFTATLNIYGEKGTIKLSGADIVHWSVPGVEQPAAPEQSAVAVSTHLLASNEQHKAQLDDIASALTDARDALVTGEQGAQSVALIEAVYQSAAQRRPTAL